MSANQQESTSGFQQVTHSFIIYISLLITLIPDSAFVQAQSQPDGSAHSPTSTAPDTPHVEQNQQPQEQNEAPGQAQTVDAPKGGQTPEPEGQESTQNQEMTLEVDQQLAEAKQHVRKGETLFESENFNAALSEFEKAYELLEGNPRRPFVLYNIGLCYERLFRYDLAMTYYDRYLQESDANAEERTTVQATIRALDGLLATLHISSNIKAEVWVDNKMMGEAPGSVLIPGGRHTVELRAVGYEPARKEINIAARESRVDKFELNEIIEYEGISPIYFWTGTALTLGTLVAGTIVGVQALTEDSQGQERKDALGAFGNIKEQEDHVRNLALTADILFGTTALLAVGTTFLFFLTDWSEESEEADPKDHQGITTHMSAMVTEDMLGVDLRGSY